MHRRAVVGMAREAVDRNAVGYRGHNRSTGALMAGSARGMIILGVGHLGGMAIGAGAIRCSDAMGRGGVA